MTTAILVAGIGLLLLLAIAAVRPAWRLPAVALGLLAIPGNVDNLMPQMTLDAHPLANNTAPAVSVIDLLVGWAVLLTIRERPAVGRLGRRLVLLGLLVLALTTVAALAALARGVEPLAVLRGVLLFARIPALLYLAAALLPALGDGRRLALAVVAGGVSLVGNGIYTTLTTSPERFTASTFGRNGFAVVLVLSTIVAAGYAFRRWHEAGGRLPALAAAGVAAACLFGAAATGTRMALIILLGAGAAALVLFPGSFDRRSLARIGAVAAAVVIVTLSSVTFTAGAHRTLSIITEPETTIDVVTTPGTTPEAFELRSRSEFWQQAIAMARDNPIFGVGPFQWNIQRYVIDPRGPQVVADAHNGYLQMGAEYGLVALFGYAVLLAVVALLNLRLALHRAARRSLGWAGLGLVVAGLVYPVAEVTNSHLFNVRTGSFGWLLLASGVMLAARHLAVPADEPARLAAAQTPTRDTLPDDLRAGA